MIFVTVEAISPRDNDGYVLFQGDLDAGVVLKCFASIAAVCLPSEGRPANQWMVVSEMEGCRLVIDAPVITARELGLGGWPAGPMQFRYSLEPGKQADDLSLAALTVRAFCRAYPYLCSEQVAHWLSVHTNL